jgi:polyisoprenoid-binding protein YceI
MFRIKLFAVSFFFLSFVFSVSALSANKVVHAKKGESQIEYTLVHPLHTVHGICKDFDCDINYDDTTGKVTGVNVIAEVLSFDSGNSNRDSHMAEVMDAIDYPYVTLKSDSIKYLKNDSLLVFSELTFHNITKKLPVGVSESFQNGNTFFNGGFDISLTEFKVKRPSLLLMPVEDKLAVSFKIVAPQDLKK